MTSYRFKKWFDLGIILTVFFAMFAISTMAAGHWDGSVEWNKVQGADSLACEKLGDGPRTADGWIHWIVTSADKITKAELVLGGTGVGNYSPTKYGPVVEFFTPFFPIEGLSATLFFDGYLGNNTQFVISDYCPGVAKEELTVTKTVDTSFNRTHDWSIAKSVDKDTFYLFVDGSGDGKATWEVDVTYLGYVDADHKVSGTIKIENTGNLDAVITKVEDVLGGTAIPVDCGVAFPFLLVEDATLTCTYSVDGMFKDYNVATVTTERDVYSGKAEIKWGEPVNDVNATVFVEDVSDLLGTKKFDELDAYDYNENQLITLKYSHDFDWATYGKDKCGTHMYENTATLYGDDMAVLGFGTADVTVYVQCFVYETAFARATTGSTCFLDLGFSRWGWTNMISEGTYTMPVYAGAGQCMGGTLVGNVKVSYIGGVVAFTFELDPMYDLDETHVYAGYTKVPEVKVGKRTTKTVAPGQYYVTKPLMGDIYVIAHAVVGLPDPSFGP
jgi:hypothetical protein